MKMPDKLEDALIGLGVVLVIALTNYLSSKLASKKAVTASIETRDSVTKNNGGSSVKDALDRVEAGNQWLDGRMDRVVDLVERVVVKQEQDHHLLVTHIEECRNGEGN
jgi:hypothetical protein